MSEKARASERDAGAVFGDDPQPRHEEVFEDRRPPTDKQCRVPYEEPQRPLLAYVSPDDGDVPRQHEREDEQFFRLDSGCHRLSIAVRDPTGGQAMRLSVD